MVCSLSQYCGLSSVFCCRQLTTSLILLQNQTLCLLANYLCLPNGAAAGVGRQRSQELLYHVLLVAERYNTVSLNMTDDAQRYILFIERLTNIYGQIKQTKLLKHREGYNN